MSVFQLSSKIWPGWFGLDPALASITNPVVFPAEYATSWREVGRICFYLTESRIVPDYSLAFLVTYITGLSASGWPLHKQLRHW